jgi:hypothetical protein
MRLFAEVTSNKGKKEVVCVIQQLTKNKKTKKPANKLLLFLQQDRLFKKHRVVQA